jgi:hypothetical protein
MERDRILTGVAGEYFVAAELSRRGYLASITLRNTKGVDVLCSNADASRSVGIQVKTAAGRKRSWILRAKSEEVHAENLFYVFVNIDYNLHAPPDFTVVPSKIVADYVRTTHAHLLTLPKRNGEPRLDSAMRIFKG